jgi:peptide/nickel transport system substrate-binding protein
VAASQPATRAITIAVTGAVYGLGLQGGTSAGGWRSLNEIHSDGLITSDLQSRRPVARLAERVPSIDDGTLMTLSDGRTRAVYALKRGVTWQDGTPFTADDLVFAHAVNSDRGLPWAPNDIRAVREIESVEAPDAYTAVFTFRGPYYLADSLGLKSFWPQPRHLLQEPYDKYLQSQNADDFINIPYWSSGYVHLGAFRLAAFEPDALTFRDYEGYFLGKPKIDTIRVQPFGDANTLFAGLLAGTVDLFPNSALNADLAEQLKAVWESGGQGIVHAVPGYTRFLELQWRRDVQREPANLDSKVRAALYLALDREEMAEVLEAGHRELAAYSLLPSNTRNYEATRDGLLRYRYDPGRARALLQEAGWTAGPDGALRNLLDGRPYRTSVWSTPGADKEVATIADFWRRIGIDVEEYTVPAALTRDRQYRSSFPGWETSANTGEEAIIGNIETSGTGTRGGYTDPRGQALVDAFRRSISPPAQLEAMRAIAGFIATELPVLPLYHQLDYLGVRKDVNALDDLAGGAGAGEQYGTYSRNAYQWELR